MQASTAKTSGAVMDPEPAATRQSNEFGTLFKHLSHYLGGRVAPLMLGFVSFPILTRIFSVEQYGNISLVLTAVVLATAFSKLGLQNSAYRYYDEHVTKGDGISAAKFQSTLDRKSVM